MSAILSALAVAISVLALFKGHSPQGRICPCRHQPAQQTPAPVRQDVPAAKVPVAMKARQPDLGRLPHSKPLTLPVDPPRQLFIEVPIYDN